MKAADRLKSPEIIRVEIAELRGEINAERNLEALAFLLDEMRSLKNCLRNAQRKATAVADPFREQETSCSDSQGLIGGTLRA